MAEAWERGGRLGKSRLIPEEFALHSGRIEGVTRLVAMRASPLVIQRKGGWSSNAFMTYVRGNMEDLRWVLEVVSGRTEARDSQHKG